MVFLLGRQEEKDVYDSSMFLVSFTENRMFLSFFLKEWYYDRVDHSEKATFVIVCDA